MAEPTSNTVRQLASFGLGETQLIGSVHRILAEHIHDAGTRQLIMEDLRALFLDIPYNQGVTNTEKLQNLHGVVLNCSACGDMVATEPTLPRWNVSDPDIVFVTDKPLTPGDDTAYFVDSLKRAGFSSDRVCATSVVRCQPTAGKLERDIVSNCATKYLYTELGLMKPKLIIACGSLASKVLLKRRIKVSEEQGEIHWVGPWAVMVQTSPGYAINSEAAGKQFQDAVEFAYKFVYG